MSNYRRVMWNGTVRALPLRQQLNAASMARCEALSVTPSDYARWLGDSLSTRDMMAMAADAGVRLHHLDPLVRWVDLWRPDIPSEVFPTGPIGFDMDDFFRIAAALRVESFTAWAAFPAGRYTTPQLIDAFGDLCRRAAVEGLRCDLEFIPVFGIRDLAAGWEIVRGAGTANSGIVLDLWHYMRGGRNDALLRSIPGERITAVQISDATTDLPEGMSMIEDGLDNRCAPGEADFPVEEIMALLRETGGLNNVGPEIFSSRFDRMSWEEIGGISGKILDEALAPARAG